jgi:hypothetical protein
MTVSRAKERKLRFVMHQFRASMKQFPDVPALTIRQFVEAEAARPMRAPTKQRDLEHDSIFGEAWKQKELFP